MFHPVAAEINVDVLDGAELIASNQPRVPVLESADPSVSVHDISGDVKVGSVLN